MTSVTDKQESGFIWTRFGRTTHKTADLKDCCFVVDVGNGNMGYSVWQLSCASAAVEETRALQHAAVMKDLTDRVDEGLPDAAREALTKSLYQEALRSALMQFLLVTSGGDAEGQPCLLAAVLPKDGRLIAFVEADDTGITLVGHGLVPADVPIDGWKNLEQVLQLLRAKFLAKDVA